MFNHEANFQVFNTVGNEGIVQQTTRTQMNAQIRGARRENHLKLFCSVDIREHDHRFDTTRNPAFKFSFCKFAINREVSGASWDIPDASVRNIDQYIHWSPDSHDTELVASITWENYSDC